MSWILYAFISAAAAALTAILAKIGVEGVPSTLATAIRTVVIVVFAWMMVLGLGEQSRLATGFASVARSLARFGFATAPRMRASARTDLKNSVTQEFFKPGFRFRRSLFHQPVSGVVRTIEVNDQPLADAPYRCHPKFTTRRRFALVTSGSMPVLLLWPERSYERMAVSL